MMGDMVSGMSGVHSNQEREIKRTIILYLAR